MPFRQRWLETLEEVGREKRADDSLQRQRGDEGIERAMGRLQLVLRRLGTLVAPRHVSEHIQPPNEVLQPTRAGNRRDEAVSEGRPRECRPVFGMRTRVPRSSMIQLRQIVPKLVDGPLFGDPNMVTKTLNIRHDLSWEHEEVFPRIG
jgi:hypothetical protein